MTEAQLLEHVLAVARMRGWTCWHFHDSRRQVAPGRFVGDRDAKGFPDVVLVHPAYGVLFWELKSDRGRVRPEQVAALLALRAAGMRADVIRPRDLARVSLELVGVKTDLAPLDAAPLRRRGAGSLPPTTTRRIA